VAYRIETFGGPQGWVEGVLDRTPAVYVVFDRFCIYNKTRLNYEPLPTLFITNQCENIVARFATDYIDTTFHTKTIDETTVCREDKRHQPIFGFALLFSLTAAARIPTTAAIFAAISV